MEFRRARNGRDKVVDRRSDRRLELAGGGTAGVDIDVVGAERLQLAQELAVVADTMAELDGVPPAPPWDLDAVSARAAVLVRDLVEPARVTTLDKLDEGRQALTIATAWLRSKVQPTVVAEPDGPLVGATR